MNGETNSYLHGVGVPGPSPGFDLNESFRVAFLLEFGGLQLRDFRFSTVGTIGVRQGRQLFGNKPQLSNIPLPSPLSSFTIFLLSLP